MVIDPCHDQRGASSVATTNDSDHIRGNSCFTEQGLSCSVKIEKQGRQHQREQQITATKMKNMSKLHGDHCGHSQSRKLLQEHPTRQNGRDYTKNQLPSTKAFTLMTNNNMYDDEHEDKNTEHHNESTETGNKRCLVQSPEIK